MCPTILKGVVLILEELLMIDSGCNGEYSLHKAELVTLYIPVCYTENKGAGGTFITCFSEASCLLVMGCCCCFSKRNFWLCDILDVSCLLLNGGAFSCMKRLPLFIS